MTKEAKALIGEVDPEQIDAWKKKHTGVMAITVKGHICYLKDFDRRTIGYALSQIDLKTGDGSRSLNMGQIYKLGEVAMQNCWLGGSEEIRKDDKLYIGACMTAGELLNFEEAELKKL